MLRKAEGVHEGFNLADQKPPARDYLNKYHGYLSATACDLTCYLI